MKFYRWTLFAFLGCLAASLFLPRTQWIWRRIWADASGVVSVYEKPGPGSYKPWEPGPRRLNVPDDERVRLYSAAFQDRSLAADQDLADYATENGDWEMLAAAVKSSLTSLFIETENVGEFYLFPNDRTLEEGPVRARLEAGLEWALLGQSVQPDDGFWNLSAATLTMALGDADEAVARLKEAAKAPRLRQGQEYEEKMAKEWLTRTAGDLGPGINYTVAVNTFNFHAVAYRDLVRSLLYTRPIEEHEAIREAAAECGLVARISAESFNEAMMGVVTDFAARGVADARGIDDAYIHDDDVPRSLFSEHTIQILEAMNRAIGITWSATDSWMDANPDVRTVNRSFPLKRTTLFVLLGLILPLAGLLGRRLRLTKPCAWCGPISSLPIALLAAVTEGSFNALVFGGVLAAAVVTMLAIPETKGARLPVLPASIIVACAAAGALALDAYGLVPKLAAWSGFTAVVVCLLSIWLEKVEHRGRLALGILAIVSAGLIASAGAAAHLWHWASPPALMPALVCASAGFLGLAAIASRTAERQQAVSGMQLILLTVGLGFSVQMMLTADSFYAGVQSHYEPEWSRIQAEVIPILEEVQASKSR